MQGEIFEYYQILALYNHRFTLHIAFHVFVLSGAV